MDIVFDKNAAKLGNFSSILRDLFKIINIFSSRRRVQLILLLLLQIIGGFAEVLSLGAVIPFLSAISNVSSIIEKPEIQPFMNFFHIDGERNFIIFTSVAFAAAFTFVNIFKMFIFWLQNEFTVALGSDINKKFFAKIMYQDFEYHLNTNSGSLISRTFVDLSFILSFVNSAMLISAQSISILAIVAAVIYYNALAAIIIFSSTLTLYFIISSLSKKRIVNNGKVISDSRAVTVNNLQAALGGIRDVFLNNNHKYFIDNYAVSDKKFRVASINTQFLSILPRYLIEIIGVIVLVSVSVFYSISDGDFFGAMPLIGALALATIRILPAVQVVYSSYASMQSKHVSVERALNILSLKIQNSKPIEVNNLPKPAKSICLNDVWFRFKGGENTNQSDWILKGVDITIPVNKTVAFVGKTGGGKTTISDIILGLLVPNKGSVSVDGIPINNENLSNWRVHVSSVPQSIFLIDASVKENVAFGEKAKNIDIERVKKVCALAQIDELIESRANKYDEVIGENGLKLSGGQRQRIGIARALYKESSVLVLDEATSALDNKTEKTVMNTISKLHGSKTIIVIAHRLETIKNADLVYVIDNGKVVAKGSYDELLNNSDIFRDIALKNID